MMRELQPGDPQRVGPYRLRGRLGAGGMGQVYLGLSPGGRQVAVKVIRADLAEDAEFRARFRREIAVARTVSGLFTAPVIDADVDGPVPWLATAYVRGPSLAEAVSEHGPLPAASVLALARGLAEGLSAIHAAGVVHRDLKPANVLLAEDGPRVIDFGISRAVEASALTHTGLVVGSPGFMSPEQAEGREVGPPSDIFSLGALLAFAATGQGPFGSGSTPALVYRVVYSEPQLGLLPAEVRPLVERCLAKDPARRPTAGDLVGGAAYPAAGWLPEPVTRARAVVPPTMTAAAPPFAAPAVVPGAPPAVVPGRAARQARRRGRWRPLTVTLVLSGLVGAGATAAVMMTAGSAPAHAAQSAPQTAPDQPLAPTGTPASPASSGPAAVGGDETARPPAPLATGPAYTAPTSPAPAYPRPTSTPPATMTPPASSAAPGPTATPSPATSSAPGASSSASTTAPAAPAAAQQGGY